MLVFSRRSVASAMTFARTDNWRGTGCGIIVRMKKVVLSLAAIISTGSVFAECGEHYPENQGHGCIYAYRFGKSKEPGPRERVFEFKETRSLGTVLFAFGNHLTVAAQMLAETRAADEAARRSRRSTAATR